jgi:hypothetical protein
MTMEEIVLAEIRKNIAAMPDEQRIQTEAIATTLRNVVTHGGPPAAYALALIGAEMAAE